MLRVLTVLVLLLVTSPASSEERDSNLVAKCQGISHVLNLPDSKVFQAMSQQEEMKVRKQFGVNSEEHVSILVKHAFGRGYGNGFSTNLLKEKGMDTALQVFMSFCWNDSPSLRTDTLARLDFLQKK